MTEFQEEQGAESFNLGRIVDIAKRRHVHFLIALFAGWLLVWGAAWILHPRYKSSTLILVQEPTMPADYVQPNVRGDLQDRLQSISQQIMSRTRLLSIIQSLNLYDWSRHKQSDDDIVERMRKDIAIELVHDARNNEINAFRVSYSSGSPVVARNVTTQLTDLFIRENLRVRQQESQQTTQFIEQQLETARQRLAEQESKVRTFQSAHMGDLPTQQASNMQILSGLQSQLQNEQDALNTAKQTRVYLQALMAQNKPVKGQPRSADPAVAAVDQQISQLRAQLADLSSRYTDKYPDVVRLKEQIVRMEQQRNQLASHSAAGGASDGGASQSPELTQLQGQFHANQLEIANREHTVADLQARIGQYQGRLNSAPATEQQLADLSRGYDQSKADYDNLLKKRNESAMATSLEQAQQGERFSVLDPPSLPVKPAFPNRVLFFGLGLLFGVAAGVVVAAAFEWFDDRLYSESEIKALLPIAVISEIPQVKVTSDEKRVRKMATLKWGMTATVIIIMIAGAAVTLLRA